jgi:hypothetical protein
MAGTCAASRGRTKGPKLGSVDRFGKSQVWVLFGLLIGVGIFGISLIVSAPFDDAARLAIGSSLVTGVVVSLAVNGANRAQRLRQLIDLAESAHDQLGKLATTCMEAYWEWLVPYVVDGPQSMVKPPQGFKNGDIQEVQRLVQWTIERTAADVRWWYDLKGLNALDAASFVASDLIERLTQIGALDESANEDVDAIPLVPDVSVDDDRQRERLVRPIENCIARLDHLAQRLAEGGDISKWSFKLDKYIEALSSPDTLQIYAPQLESLLVEDEVDDGVVYLTGVEEGRHLEWVRTLVGWIVDRLRKDGIDIDYYDRPVPPTDQPAEVYRWGTLLSATQDPTAVWEQRFADDSWLRGQFEEAHQGLREWVDKMGLAWATTPEADPK